MKGIENNHAELAILHRLKLARLKLNVSQESFADRIQVKRGTYANYEYFKAALPSDLALKICEEFFIGEVWLATGEGHWRQFLWLKVMIKNHDIPYGLSYGEVYKKYYSKAANLLKNELDELGLPLLVDLNLMSITAFDKEYIRTWMNALTDVYIDKLDERDLGNWACLMTESSHKFYNNLKNETLSQEELEAVFKNYKLRFKVPLENDQSTYQTPTTISRLASKVVNLGREIKDHFTRVIPRERKRFVLANIREPDSEPPQVNEEPQNISPHKSDHDAAVIGAVSTQKAKEKPKAPSKKNRDHLEIAARAMVAAQKARAKEAKKKSSKPKK